MSELLQILDLWHTAKQQREDVCLVTVVRVQGSSYRKPGARMLLTQRGLRAGTVSGGCLEAEVAKKAWWLTEKGAALREFSSFFEEDAEMPYGLGCGGVVSLLLERGAAATAVLALLDDAVRRRIPAVVLTAIEPQSSAGTLLCMAEDGQIPYVANSVFSGEYFTQLAHEVFHQRRSLYTNAVVFDKQVEIFAQYIAPPPALFIFGAGDDVLPLANFAHTLGWHITVADGRSHLATQARFPSADCVAVLDYRGQDPLNELNISFRDAAVILTHSYEQDRALLTELLPRDMAYLGILGPKLRTERLISEVAPIAGLAVEECWRRLHSPVGLDLGSETPAAIALSITAEIQAILHSRDVSVRRKDLPDSVHA